MSEKSKPIIPPNVCVDHDRERYYIEVELPGVDKGDIELEVSEQGFCVKGSREDAELAGCYFLAHPISVDEVKAKFENGLLKITAPLRQPLTGKKVTIE